MYVPLCQFCAAQIDYLPHLPIRLHCENTALTSVYSATMFRGVAKQVVKKLKYDYVKAYAEVGASILLRNFPPISAEVITWVPLHPHKQADRGFNQAEEMARYLGNWLGRPAVPLLTRRINAPPQAQQNSLTERSQRLAGHFALHSQSLSYTKELSRTTIMIIDDVCTTGATLHECAVVLQSLGCRKIYGYTVAHGL